LVRMQNIKTNHIYIAIAVVVVIILGFVFWGGDEAQEVEDQIVDTSTSTPTSTQTTNRPTSSGSTRRPTPPPIETPIQEPVPSIPSASSLDGSIFRMTSYNGVALPTDSKYTLSFEDGILSAKFCNSVSGNFVLDGNLLKANNLIGTMMYCATPTNLMEIESTFVSMLNFGAILYQTGNKIILSYSKGTVMVFTGF